MSKRTEKPAVIVVCHTDERLGRSWWPTPALPESRRARPEKQVELSSRGVGVEGREILDAADLFSAEAVTVVEAEVTGALAAEVTTKSAGVGVRMEVPFAGDVIDFSVHIQLPAYFVNVPT